MLNRFLSLGVLFVFSGLLQGSALPNFVFEHRGIEIAQSAEDQVGAVNPNRPIRIDITNAGDIDVVFSLSQPVSASRRVAAGSSTSFGATHTNYLPPPVYLLAYPERAEIAVNFYVLSTDNNVVEVVVGGQYSDIPAGRTLTIESDGTVYVF